MGKAKAPGNPHYKHKNYAIMLHQRNRNNKRNQYQMALFGKKKKPKNRSENISFQIDNVSQRAKQLLFSLSMSLCTLGHCPIRWIWSTPPPWPTPHGGVGSGGGTRGISSLSFFPSQGLRLKGLK